MSEETRVHNQQIIEEQLVILEEDPANRDSLFEVAFRYQQLGEWKDAIKYYKKVIEVSPTDWAALNNMAYMYETMGDFDLAASYIKSLYESDPGNIEVMKDTVRILLLAGDSKDAQLALENFARLKMDPENPDADMAALIGGLYEQIYQWNQENGQPAN